MKTIEQIESQIAELQADLEALKAQSKECQQQGDAYFHLSGIGEIVQVVYDGLSFDSGSFAQGNAFRTKDEAETERDARAVVAELRKQPGRKKFAAWFRNYGIRCVLSSQRVCPSGYWSEEDSSWHHLYFDSNESARAAINAVGADRILKAAKWWACGEC